MAQLAFTTKEGFQNTPRKIELGKHSFVVDVACGDGHSLALTNAREVIAWGSNKQGQLGYDPDAYPMVTQPRKLILYEYMNSSNRETFSAIKASSTTTVLIADSKHIYLS